jgi:hypothetical protein
LNVEEGVKDEGKWRMNEEWRPNTNMHFSCLPAPPTSKHEENDEKQTSIDNAQEKG